MWTQAPRGLLSWTLTRQVGQAALVVLIFAILARNIAQNWDTIRLSAGRISPGYLAASTACVAAHLLMAVAIWRHMLASLGFPLSFVGAFRIWFLASFTRYLPGRIWSVIGIVYLCEKAGVPRAPSIASGVLNQVFSLITGALLGTFVFPLPFRGAVPTELWGLAATVVVLGVAVHPRGFRWILGLAARVRGVPPIAYRGTAWSHAGYLASYFAAWGLFGAGLFLFARSFADLSARTLPYVVAVFAFANIAGFLSFLTPNGLGVREGLLSYLLSPYLTLGVATAVAVSFRFWIILIEAVYFSVAVRLR